MTSPIATQHPSTKPAPPPHRPQNVTPARRDPQPSILSPPEHSHDQGAEAGRISIRLHTRAVSTQPLCSVLGEVVEGRPGAYIGSASTQRRKLERIPSIRTQAQENSSSNLVVGDASIRSP
ncbi:hypothetical protein BJ508DRAFT_416318 [Ascobolus immersus RN42]|uniref:Uncharacterized protein n=1 Tax=Ascobolus immersus RN42 TaxID=1160509 RepID=A0A3N4HYA2_ASCIM|nr:hypothetical protein BJ508DRAFT_416318 [Ascobolus immersus RN42]